MRSSPVRHPSSEGTPTDAARDATPPIGPGRSPCDTEDMRARTSRGGRMPQVPPPRLQTNERDERESALLTTARRVARSEHVGQRRRSGHARRRARTPRRRLAVEARGVLATARRSIRRTGTRRAAHRRRRQTPLAGSQLVRRWRRTARSRRASTTALNGGGRRPRAVGASRLVAHGRAGRWHRRGRAPMAAAEAARKRRCGARRTRRRTGTCGRASTAVAERRAQTSATRVAVGDAR